MQTITDHENDRATLLTDVLEGLQQENKSLPSKYFYDKRGSELFEEICELDEYYPTRTELSIMRDNMNEMTSCLGDDLQLIELGSGSSLKTRLLLDHLQDIHSYVPVDISDDFLADVANSLQREYPVLDILPVATDYTQPFELPEMDKQIRRIAYYPGSTIGNFTKDDAADFIALIADLVGASGGLLIGFDLLKNRETLIAAYDDSKGITAAFNKNILRRINRELDANFNLNAFQHKAVFNEQKSRIEMHLVSLKNQEVSIPGTKLRFKEGESIHTENSHKYTIESFRELTEPHFTSVKTWTDKNNRFAVQYLQK